MRKGVLVLLAVVFIGGIASAQLYAGYNGQCAKGGQSVLLANLPSQGTQPIVGGSKTFTSGVLASYPNCLVSVFLTGTLTPATLYQNVALTPLVNPFTANADGSFFFVSATGVGYDIVLTGGGLPAQVSLTDVFLGAASPAGNPALPSGSFQGNCSGIFCSIPNLSFNPVSGAIATIASFSPTGGGTLGGTFLGTYTLGGTATLVNPILPITGLTQCVQVNSLGQPSGAGAPCGTSSLPSGSICLPFINTNGSTNYVTSPTFCDASRFTGATIDVLVNSCLGTVFSMLGNLPCDARAIKSGTLTSPGGTIAAEIDVNEPPAPALSVPAGGSLASGTFKVCYTLVSSYGESSCSNEASASTSGTCPSSGSCTIQVPSPPYPGIATTYKVKMTAAGGSSWTEVDCGTNTAIGSATNITSACGGASVSKNNTATELILPPTGGWAVSITDGVSYGLKFGDRSYVHGSGVGEGQRFAILNQNSSTNVGALGGSDLNAKNGNNYMAVEKMSFQNNGGTVTVAAFSFQNFYDHSRCRDIDVVNNNSIGVLINNGGAGSDCTFHAEGSSGAGARPAVVGGSGSIGFGEFDCHDCVAVHAGSGFPEIEVPRSQQIIHFSGITYVEGNNANQACGDATTPLMKVGTVNNVGGIIIDNLGTASTCSTSTAPILELENAFNCVACSFYVQTIYSNRSTTLINDLSGFGPGVTCATAPCSYPGPYTYGKGASAYFLGGQSQGVGTLAKAPPCSSGIGESVYYTATNCNAGCSQGGTCTAGGTTHCELRCNASGAFVETGN